MSRQSLAREPRTLATNGKVYEAKLVLETARTYEGFVRIATSFKIVFRSHARVSHSSEKKNIGAFVCETPYSSFRKHTVWHDQTWLKPSHYVTVNFRVSAKIANGVMSY